MIRFALRLGTWTSEIQYITPELSQGSAISPVLFNMHTIGITSNQLEGPERTINVADEVLVYLRKRNR